MPLLSYRKASLLIVSLSSATLILPSCAQVPNTPETTSATMVSAPISKPDFSQVPGTVITYSPQSSKLFVGSPSIAVLPNGDYVAKSDEFGFGIEKTRAITRVFGSSDKGNSWHPICVINGVFWSTLFVHRGQLYLLGNDKEYGNIVILRSDDGGKRWTQPKDEKSGLLRTDGHFHCGAVPVIEHGGRLWRAFEDADGPGGWGSHFRAFMMSAPLDSDLLNARSWTHTNSLARDASWNNDDFGGWLEGNAIVTPQGHVVDMLRVDTKSPEEKAAMVQISDDGKTASFDPQSGFIDFPGGAKKFTIRYDSQSRQYWSLVNYVPPRHRVATPGAVRNTLALVASSDLQKWTVRCVVLYHPDTIKHGFQYADWLFDGNDLIAAVRTAYDDGLDGAHNYHDANFITFHRIKNFRHLTMADSVSMPEAVLIHVETPQFVLSGHNFEIASLANGQRAFTNRDYVWTDLPPQWQGKRLTRLNGGQIGDITINAKTNGTLSIATALSQPGPRLDSWQPTGQSFHYNDREKTLMTILNRSVKAGESITIPQGNWTGTVVLLRD